MLIYKRLYPSPGVVGVSQFHVRECLISYKLAWTVYSLSIGMNSLDITGVKRLKSLVEIGQKGTIDLLCALYYAINTLGFPFSGSIKCYQEHDQIIKLVSHCLA
ncbi:Folylpolyglutamate synthase [Forsythia ovata]|uniref:Folylpolyglutamate synthase n=1 Tax=Forsythia ovata TaxID=205694 RepID=A0ABD1WWQ1_9LAMI